MGEKRTTGPRVVHDFSFSHPQGSDIVREALILHGNDQQFAPIRAFVDPAGE